MRSTWGGFPSLNPTTGGHIRDMGEPGIITNTQRAAAAQAERCRITSTSHSSSTPGWVRNRRVHRVDWTLEPTGENHEELAGYVLDPQTSNERQQSCFLPNGFSWSWNEANNIMESTDLALIKCHEVGHEDELHQTEEMLKDALCQEEGKWIDDEVDDLASEAEDTEMLSWYFNKTGLSLHRDETYRAYEAFGEWKETMRIFDENMESDMEGEDDTRDKEMLRRHLKQEEEIEMTVPLLARPPWQVRCDHCCRVTSVTSVYQASYCPACDMKHEWPPLAYIRRLSRDFGRPTEDEMIVRREAIRLDDEQKIMDYDKHLEQLLTWQRKQELEAHFAETRRLYGLGTWRGTDNLHGLGLLGVVDRVVP